MDGIYNSEGRGGLQFADFEVPTSDDDSSVLLSNTNKLLSAVGITAKKISSTDELSRVASSMIVAVFESLFHQKITGIVRNPSSIEHYERNAQLVIDSLSDQIQLDLQHITGKSIVSGDLRVLSNLVHILVRIVSLTSQESLTSYDSSHYEDRQKYRLPFRPTNQFSNENGSISTHESDVGDLEALGRKEQPYYVASTAAAAAAAAKGGGKPFGTVDPISSFSHDTSHRAPEMFNEDLRRSLVQMEKLMQIETKLEAARVRRSNHLQLKESICKAANMRHTEASREALQRKWLEEEERTRQSYLLKQSSDDQLVLRKVYRGLLQRVAQWRVEEQKEEKAKKIQLKDQAAQNIKALQALFEERMQLLTNCNKHLQETRLTASVGVKGERDIANGLLQSINARNRNLLARERARLQQQRQRESLRRREAHKDLLAMLTVGKWENMLRNANFE